MLHFLCRFKSTLLFPSDGCDFTMQNHRHLHTFKDTFSCKHSKFRHVQIASLTIQLVYGIQPQIWDSVHKIITIVRKSHTQTVIKHTYTHTSEVSSFFFPIKMYICKCFLMPFALQTSIFYVDSFEQNVSFKKKEEKNRRKKVHSQKCWIMIRSHFFSSNENKLCFFWSFSKIFIIFLHNQEKSFKNQENLGST